MIITAWLQIFHAQGRRRKGGDKRKYHNLHSTLQFMNTVIFEEWLTRESLEHIYSRAKTSQNQAVWYGVGHIIIGFSSISVSHTHKYMQDHPVQMEYMSAGLFFLDGWLVGWKAFAVIFYILIHSICTDSKQNMLLSRSIHLQFT